MDKQSEINDTWIIIKKISSDPHDILLIKEIYPRWKKYGELTYYLYRNIFLRNKKLKAAVQY